MSERSICPEGHKHAQNTTCYYEHSCRCSPCRALIAQRRLSGVASRVPVGLIRAHVDELTNAGFSAHAIGVATGLGPRTANLSGKQHVSARVANTLLAVSVASLIADDRLYMRSRGAQRRIQALATLGWSQRRLAERIGLTQEHIWSFLANPLIPTRWHRAIGELYEELWDTRPAAATPSQRAGINTVIRRAAANGWLPPLAWDDIDLDAAPPEGIEAEIDEIAVELAIRGEAVKLRPAERDVAVERLNGMRLNDTAIAARLHCSASSVEKTRARLGIPAVCGPDRLQVAS